MRASPPPISVSMVIALAAGLGLTAVPMYLWRDARPRVSPAESNGDGVKRPPAHPGVHTIDGGLLRNAVPPIDALEAAAERASVKLSPFRTIRCVKHGSGKTPPDRCDHLDRLEKAVEEAIRRNATLGPSTPKGAMVSFVMDVDFRARRLKIYRGKSSTVAKKHTEELFRRVRKAVPPPNWASDDRDHYRYVVSVTASYAPSRTF